MKETKVGKKLKNQKAITLIALIVTIIVLLILAGISIGALTGDNGILGQAKIAKKDTERKGIEEQINVMVVQSTNKRGTIDKEKLIEKLNTLPEGKEIVESDNKIYVVYPEYSFEIDLGTGDVTQPNIEISKDETPWELAGSGTESDPFLIESIEDLVAFSNNVNNGNRYTNQYVKLVNTLDFNLPFSYNDPKTKVSEETNRIIAEDENGTELKTFLTSGTGFNPIGKDLNYSFRGIWDGNNKEIKNIHINRPEEDYVGLVGYGAYSLIRNITVDGKIIGKDKVGGIAGYIYSGDGVEVSNCWNKADIKGETSVAGIVSVNPNKIKQCFNEGIIEGSSNVGGIIGFQNNNAIVNCCYNKGEIIASGGSGGIVGYNNGGRICNSYNYGDITGTNVGGITQENYRGGSIEKCYNLGDTFIVLNTYVQYENGGICGMCYGDVTNSYNCGNINGIDSRIIKGGICGYKSEEDSTITSCYYKKGTASGGINGEDITGQAEPLEESEMPSVIDVVQNQIEVNGETINVWKEDTNNINNGYPILYWQ